MKIFTSPLLHHMHHLTWCITAMMLLGIITSSYYQQYALAAALCGISCIIAHVAQTNHKHLLLLMSALSFSLFIGAFNYFIQQKQHSLWWQSLNDSSLNIIATVESIEKRDSQTGRYLITLRTHQISSSHTNEWKNTIITLQCQANSYFALEVDDRILLHNIHLQEPKGDFKKYLIKEGIFATFFTGQLQQQLLYRPKLSLKRWIYNTRRHLFYRLKKKIGQQAFSLFSSIFLGNKSIGKETFDHAKAVCKIWGLSHYLARSGLHLVIFLMLWILLLRLLPIPFVIKQLTSCGILSVYFLLSWPSISFYRALLTSALYHICNITIIPINVLHVLLLVLLAVVINNPCQLFFLDFQLSFGLTFIMILMNHIATSKKQLSTKSID